MLTTAARARISAAGAALLPGLFKLPSQLEISAILTVKSTPATCPIKRRYSLAVRAILAVVISHLHYLAVKLVHVILSIEAALAIPARAFLLPSLSAHCTVVLSSLPPSVAPPQLPALSVLLHKHITVGIYDIPSRPVLASILITTRPPPGGGFFLSGCYLFSIYLSRAA